jgi:hypothetical protein
MARRDALSMWITEWIKIEEDFPGSDSSRQYKQKVTFVHDGAWNKKTGSEMDQDPDLTVQTHHSAASPRKSNCRYEGLVEQIFRARI